MSFVGGHFPYAALYEGYQAPCPCRRRNAAARSLAHCKQRHRCSPRSMHRFSA